MITPDAQSNDQPINQTAQQDTGGVLTTRNPQTVPTSDAANKASDFQQSISPDKITSSGSLSVARTGEMVQGQPVYGRGVSAWPYVGTFLAIVILAAIGLWMLRHRRQIAGAHTYGKGMTELPNQPEIINIDLAPMVSADAVIPQAVAQPTTTSVSANVASTTKPPTIKTATTASAKNKRLASSKNKSKNKRKKRY